ncbi:LexA family transcriptional regulator [Aromatoleum evansii]|uniref:LexA family transcriptional regulator n=1 Tax=Aromatoleum evansii TaxID=59406 RepID=UPI00145DA73D|nr:S24 family peptidase [Aromatoleum evansii]NMG28378.1 hypothetical protein [Aromatoleum evansii]
MSRQAELFRQRFATNFNQLLDQKGAPASGLGRTRFVSREFGVSTSSAGKWLIGATAPDPWRFGDIADYFGVSVDTLLDDGKRMPRGALSTCPAMAQIPGADSSLVCAALLEAVRNHERLSRTTVVPPLPPNYPAESTLYLLRIESNEMEPYVRHGDMVAYVPMASVSLDGEYVLSLRGTFVVRRIARVPHSDRLRLMTGDVRYPAHEVTADQLPPYHGALDLNVGMALHGLVVARLLVNR